MDSIYNKNHFHFNFNSRFLISSKNKSFHFATPNQSAVVCAGELAQYDPTSSVQTYSNTNYAWTSLPYISSNFGFFTLGDMVVYNGLLYVFGIFGDLFGSPCKKELELKLFLFWL